MEFYSHPREGKNQQTYLDHQHGTRRVISNLEVGGAGQQNSGLSEGFISQEYGITWVKSGDMENNVETEYAKSCVSTQLASLGAFFVYTQWGTPLI